MGKTSRVEKEKRGEYIPINQQGQNPNRHNTKAQHTIVAPRWTVITTRRKPVSAT